MNILKSVEPFTVFDIVIFFELEPNTFATLKSIPFGSLGRSIVLPPTIIEFVSKTRKESVLNTVYGVVPFDMLFGVKLVGPASSADCA